MPKETCNLPHLSMTITVPIVQATIVSFLKYCFNSLIGLSTLSFPIGHSPQGSEMLL